MLIKPTSTADFLLKAWSKIKVQRSVDAAMPMSNRLSGNNTNCSWIKKFMLQWELPGQIFAKHFLSFEISSC